MTTLYFRKNDEMQHYKKQHLFPTTMWNFHVSQECGFAEIPKEETIQAQMGCNDAIVIHF